MSQSHTYLYKKNAVSIVVLLRLITTFSPSTLSFILSFCIIVHLLHVFASFQNNKNNHYKRTTFTGNLNIIFSF